MPWLSAQPARRGNWGFGHLILLLLLIGAVVGAVFAYAYPWAFYLGGKFHVLPWWEGVGKAHARSGDYVFYVWIAPETRDVKTYLETNLTGSAEVCTPRGEDIVLTLGGGMRRHLGKSTDGEKIGLYVHRLTIPSSAIHHEPSLQFSGHWQNPQLVMDDGGSIGEAFGPDGRVLYGKDKSRTHSSEVVSITFSAGSNADYKAACAAMRR
jgi:hypothetical protein